MSPKPQPDKRRIAREILERLRAGKPLSDLDEFGAFRDMLGADALSLLKSTVSGYSAKGPLSGSVVIWLYAPYGGGKTETLFRFQESLVCDLDESPEKRTAIVALDLKGTPEAGSRRGLQAAVFRNAAISSTSPFAADIADAIERASRARPSEELSKQVAGLGLDLALSFLNVSVPGLGLASDRLIDRIIRWRKLRPRAIRKVLRARGVPIGTATNLMVDWIRYAADPSAKRWEVLDTRIERLASREELWSALEALLVKAKYASVVFLVDEARVLEKNRALAGGFENLWCEPFGSEDKDRLNLCFIFGSALPMRTFADEREYGGFARRFTGRDIVPAREFELSGPRVAANSGQDDDLSSAKKLLERLALFVPAGEIPQMPPDREEGLRRILSPLSDEGALRWCDFWRAVLAPGLSHMAAGPLGGDPGRPVEAPAPN